MSRGIEVYYKLVSIDKEKITYGYSGANINKEYELIKLLDYDGLIEIAIEALEKNKTLSEVFTNKEVNIIKECRYEWHENKLANGDDQVGYFAVTAVSKIFKEHKKNIKIPTKGSVVY